MAEARTLNLETIRIRRELEVDGTMDRSQKHTYMEVIESANQWDIAIKISLGAWEDVMLPSKGTTDSEKAVNLDVDTSQSHGRYIIRLMRTKCIEGIKKRRELSAHLGKIRSEINLRYV